MFVVAAQVQMKTATPWPSNTREPGKETTWPEKVVRVFLHYLRHHDLGTVHLEVSCRSALSSGRGITMPICLQSLFE